MLPKISVITPSYNQAEFLQATLDSVIGQNYTYLEYIVMDGGSTDGSVEMIRKVESRLSYWQSQPDGGQSAAINAGWARATGDWLCWLNSDDIFLPHTLTRVSQLIMENPQAVAIIGECRLIDRAAQDVGAKYARTFDLETLVTTSGGVPGQPAVFLSRQVLADVGFLAEDLHYSMDWEYWLRLALTYPPEKFLVVYEPLAAWRSWEGAKTLTGVQKICDQHRFALERLFKGKLVGYRQQWYARAMAGTWRKQAKLERQAGQPLASLRSLSMMLSFTPDLRSWQYAAKFIAKSILQKTDS
ncbi:MAG TPA: glycosyltransferase family 2 protein [Anaerolineales bacterium]|nr:glycosyltransferase family 2 protein [Anaerolineales bacterium]